MGSRWGRTSALTSAAGVRSPSPGIHTWQFSRREVVETDVVFAWLMIGTELSAVSRAGAPWTRRDRLPGRFALVRVGQVRGGGRVSNRGGGGDGAHGGASAPGRRKCGAEGYGMSREYGDTAHSSVREVLPPLLILLFRLI